MFTGIVSHIGRIIEVLPQAVGGKDAGVQLTIEAPGFLRSNTRLGDSIAIEGACMTVVAIPDNARHTFVVDVSRESLDRTVGLQALGEVNLEHALCLGDSLDGHLVSGHVDGIATVTRFTQVGESWELRLQIPADFAHYMAYKGSVTVNGVSLTINAVTDHAQGCEISINLIPHTLEVTTLKNLRTGKEVNFEVDMLARYVERMANYRPTPV